MRIKPDAIFLLLTPFIMGFGTILFSSPATAFTLYADLDYMYHDIDVGGTELNPSSVSLKLGVPVTKNVAVEVVYASGIEDDKVNALTLEVNEIVGAYFRFHSTMYGRGTHVYLLAGQAYTTITTTINNVENEEDFEDFSWAIGAEEESRAIKKFYYTFEYNRYYDDDSLNVTGISLGIKYEF